MRKCSRSWLFVSLSVVILAACDPGVTGPRVKEVSMHGRANIVATATCPFGTISSLSPGVINIDVGCGGGTIAFTETPPAGATIGSTVQFDIDSSNPRSPIAVNIQVIVVAPPVPTTIDECKNGGWQSLARPDGSSFKSQGDCVQFVNTGK